MPGIRVTTKTGEIEIGVMTVPGRKQKALYRTRSTQKSAIDVLAYFLSDDCAEKFQKDIDWIADELARSNDEARRKNT